MRKPTVTPAAPYAVPPPLKGELGRIVLTPGSDVGETVSVPGNDTAYAVDFGCTGSSKLAKIRFEVTHGSKLIVSGTGRCDGSPYRDTAIVAAHPKESVQLSLTGDTSTVSRAYLVLSSGS